ncbi:MAG: hypothetical protein JWP69_2341 [Flaviaesturariibacter sp.]|nr:hypothetical protein [Flaviaesturariibacter sp.]
MTFDGILLCIFAVNLLFFWALTFKKHKNRKTKATFFDSYLHAN